MFINDTFSSEDEDHQFEKSIDQQKEVLALSVSLGVIDEEVVDSSKVRDKEISASVHSTDNQHVSLFDVEL